LVMPQKEMLSIRIEPIIFDLHIVKSFINDQQ